MDSQKSSKINYMFLPSLKHITFVKVASMLWNRSDVRCKLSELISCECDIARTDWQSLEKAIVQKVPELQLPRQLGKLLISYIQPVGLQILDWINYHVLLRRFVTELPNEFFWTPRGSLDNKKVAETLVHDERLDISTRFKLACIYCLEDCIKLLSKKLPRGFNKEPKELIVKHWYYFVVEIGDNHSSVPAGEFVTFCHVGLAISIKTGNEAGTRYFLKRFTAENRSEVLVSCTMEAYNLSNGIYCKKSSFTEYQYSSNLCYILSEMKTSELTKLVSDNVCDILHWLLYWPWQSLFLRTAKKVWRFLLPKDYFSLLKAICWLIFLEHKDFDYSYLFGKFWLEGSSAYKRYVIINGGLNLLLRKLFVAGDEENIKMIFKVTTVQEKEEFIFCRDGVFILGVLILDGKWKLLEFFVKECILSKDVHQLHVKFNKISGFLSPFFDIKVKKACDMLDKFHKVLSAIEQEMVNSSSETS